MGFSRDFVWGAATASYQVEGAHDADGKGPSVWDAMCQRPGQVFDANHGNVASDHYHRYKEDVALMKQLGLRAYRFSFSWPRILPEGEGKLNEVGLTFYDRLIDALLEAGIQPWATLFHWDYPLALYHRGGWLNAKSPDWFAAYTRVLVDRYSDRITNWMTLNEPQCFIGMGHLDGNHAPGIQLGMDDVLRAAHHCLMAHGRAVCEIREHAKQTPVVGWAPVGSVAYPYENRDEHIEAARTAMFRVEGGSLWNNTWFSDPVVRGHYPEDGLRVFGHAVPDFTDADMKTICQPLDFFGANIYNGYPVGMPDTQASLRPAGYPQTLYHWPVEPDSLYWGPRFLFERYQLPIVITENGMSGTDWVAEDGQVHDEYRIDFLTRYIRRLRDAAADGVGINGYFHWSLMDNFEWHHGYRHRFGLVHIDFQSLKRTPKKSAEWYKTVIESNGVNL